MLMPPGRRMAGGVQRPSTTVDSTPTVQGPPSRMSSILPPRSWVTCCAVVGLGRVLAFAEGAARGSWQSWIRASARILIGMRAAKVGWPAETSGASFEPVGRGRRMLSGPGQKVEIRWL